VSEAGFEPLQVFLVQIGGNVTLAALDELAGEVSHAGADFENAFADVGTDGVGHPAVEVGRVGKGVENGHAGFVIDVGGEGILGDDPEGFERVFQADLLAFLVGAAVVADRDFVDSGLPLGELNGDLGLEAEAVGPDGNALQQGRPEGLVAGLHVGEVQVGHDVAHGRQNPVRDGMPVVEDSPLAGGEEPGAEDGVSPAV